MEEDDTKVFEQSECLASTSGCVRIELPFDKTVIERHKVKAEELGKD
jgi:hypothetical protein